MTAADVLLLAAIAVILLQAIHAWRAEMQGTIDRRARWCAEIERDRARREAAEATDKLAWMIKVHRMATAMAVEGALREQRMKAFRMADDN